LDLNTLHNIGLVWNIKLLEDLVYRPELVKFQESETKLLRLNLLRNVGYWD